MIRLFAAVLLEPGVRDTLTSIQAGLPGARWIEGDNLHVTLRFVGEVDEGVARDLDEYLAEIEVPAFDVRLTGLGTFGTGRKPSSLWVGVEDTPKDSLRHLAAKVESALVRAGLEPERRKFKPHVTIARLRETPKHKLGEFLASHNTISAGPMTVRSFSLMRSHLGAGGAHYEELVSYPLR